MFFVLSKTIGLLCMPLSLTLLGLLLFVCLRRRRPGAAWTCFWGGFIILWACSCPWGADALLRPLEKPYAQSELPARVDAIVVLGGGLDLANSTAGHVEYNPAADRIIDGIKLARRFPEALLVFSGGTGSLFDHAHTEAPLLRGEAISLGLSPDRILIDDRSRNTHENAVETRRLLAPTQAQAVLLVTSAFHMRRSLGCFRKVGLAVRPYAVDFRGHHSARNPLGWIPDVSNLGESSLAVKEYVGLIMYRLQGYV